MKAYRERTRDELCELEALLEGKYQAFKERGLRLDMSRGKPSLDQLDLAMDMMDVLHGNSDLNSKDGVDCRNYGENVGIREAREFLGEMMEVNPDQIIIYGNSSLNVMYDRVAYSMTHGVMGSVPWAKLAGNVKFLCPVPGYDRHFTITEYFGIEMVPVPMTPTGPDMDAVERYVSGDEMIKGIWCVPKYSNPQGVTYSDEVVRRFARLQPAAKDFRIYWDNAYMVHHLDFDDKDELLELVKECERAGNPDLVYKFASTSKISFPGSGLAAVAASHANLKEIKKHLTVQTIGHDKLNQLRHVRFYKNMEGVMAHMKKHADSIRPKFEMILDCFDEELGGLGIAEWIRPKGGYFISFDSMEGCAKEIVKLAKEGGVVLTGAGATYPYGRDPKDANIRIAPTNPTLEDLSLATELFVLCVKLASVRKLLAAA